MISAPIPSNEKKRLQAVEKYELLDTMPEDNYDSITDIIASICQAPISLITLVDKDRTFLKSRHGVELTESPRDISFCAHTITSEDDITIIPDATKDQRFIGSPLLTESNIAFYAGVPLIDRNGYKLGSLCVFDTKPRSLNDVQLRALKSMAKHVMVLFEERHRNMELTQAQKLLEERNEELKDFAGIVSHDLKAPLSNIMMIADLLQKENQGKISDKSYKYLQYLRDAGGSLSRYIDGMLIFYKSDELANHAFEEISYVDLVEDIVAMVVTDEHTLVTYAPEMDVTMKTSNAALHQILLNLVSNSIKYGDKDPTTIHIAMEVLPDFYQLTVEDNGRGISTEQIKSVFKLFYTAAEEDRHGKKGTGIGLATTKRLLDQLGASIDIESEVGVGTKITLKFPRDND
ncbi:GAF domain-containing sensor histidine kinase [Nonlabens marinus]|uniref:histidine kinase n=1 Tax=Nonlabens marinus S1-08 TaxID=1454201 RepID=W8VSN4_9FLAO|nr:GAF domain-containing sensor histidine kinase [Nonlabens marinus]BAO56360.1 two-component hybrid sensor and regulator [Nonlabens marinus S1-08]